MLGWDRYGFNKKRAGSHYAELMFLNLVESVGHVVHSGPFGARNIDALFFMHWCSWCGFQKKRAGTPYTEVMFLDQVESMGHIVHSGASRVRNVDAPLFMLE
jgi:hypothetical protein